LQGYRIHIDPDGSRALRDCLPPEISDIFAATCGKRGKGLRIMTQQLNELLSFSCEGPEDPIARHHPPRHETLETWMESDHTLCISLLSKIQEQIDRTVHLIQLLPANQLEGTPETPDEWPVEMLLGHLLDCLAGFCAVQAATEPERLAHFSELRSLPVNQACSPDEAIHRIAIYGDRIDEGFALLEDASLARLIPTAFVERGETVLTLFLGNLEHLINHKHQLFTHLKRMGVNVRTRDLYRFRE